METEWTKEEYEVAMDQRDELFPGFGECSGDPETEETAEKMLDLLCQRNRALAALKRIYFICSNAGHAPCRYGGIDGEGNVCPNVCNCDWPKEIIPIVYAAIAACKKGDA